jgi:hypothetical protein
LVAVSRRSPLWWAWTPYLLYSTVSAEMGTNEVLNSVSKSFVVFAVIVVSVPAWQRLWRRPRRGPSLASPAQIRRA